MNISHDASLVAAKLKLGNGDAIILIDRLDTDGATKEELARNVFRVDDTGATKWTVRSDFDFEGNPFTRISNEDGTITAYRWNGGSYIIDSETGEAKPVQLER